MGFLERLNLFRREPKFHALGPDSSDGDEEDIESEKLLPKAGLARKLAHSKSWIYFSIFNAVVLGMNVFLGVATMKNIFSSQKNADLRPTSWWSPILDDIEIPKHTTMLNGTLFALPEVSIAREEPGPENDEAWHKFEKVLTHVVTREQIIKLGKDPETVARFNDEYWGLGDDAYMVQLDVMHQIHCLNLLRKSAFESYPGYEPELDVKDKMWWIHLGHCTDILLQNLQCNANTEVLTLNWVEDRQPPWPDFSVNRKCRNFNALKDWQHENAVDPEKFDAMPVPSDAYVWPAPWKKQDYELGIKLGQHHFQEGHQLQGGEVMGDPHAHHDHQ
ncbi:hypothetical protein N7478_009695 [Penicillium angulare]|uniref:uncharacterized protein n=1 Tax=Penicillium angulare TaxID=116970 RepID=UPI002541259C|nr:uncharacterized protein N7478_009695 [Penicillium angulare]KAJ5266887.1 hypothetical protein N7478_009695 [Penicillium angulare]